MPLVRLSRRLQKLFRRQRRQVENIGHSTEKGLERNFFRRLGRLRPVRRFLIAWILLFIVIIGGLVAQLIHLQSYYQHTRPIPGGIYNEGIVGSVSNVNPIYATSDVDRSVSRLLFAGLLRYNASNALVGELAANYQISNDDRTYTFHLRHGLTWQDGRPLNSADVAYTYQAIKDPDAQSPLFSSWRGIDITAPDLYTVQFRLPSPLASFPASLTTGILPKHILGNIPAANLRSTDFNTTRPVGAGPFAWRGLAVTGNDPSRPQQQIALVPFAKFYGGQPKLSEFIIHAYATTDQLATALQAGQLTAAAGLNQPIKTKADLQNHNLVLAAGTYVFFKTSDGVLADATVRKALVLASDPAAVAKATGFNPKTVDEPLLTGQLAYDARFRQQSGDPAAARAMLASAGWTAGSNGVLTKDGHALRFNVVAVDTPEYRRDTTALQKQWRAVGARLDVQLESAADYATSFAAHDFDATLYGIAIGADPDVYVYWDSSQADVRAANRLNLSEWKNGVADSALEAGRTRLDPQLRKIKYAPFLQAWQQDAPALGLYQPRYLYITRGSVYGLPTGSINDGTDRYNNVQNWEIRTAKVTD